MQIFAKVGWQLLSYTSIPRTWKKFDDNQLISYQNKLGAYELWFDIFRLVVRLHVLFVYDGRIIKHLIHIYVTFCHFVFLLFMCYEHYRVEQKTIFES